jgi:hypothetical protein
MRTKQIVYILSVGILLCSFGLQGNIKTLNATLYSVKYPSSWEIQNASDSGKVDYYIYPPEDHDNSFNENIVIRHTDLARNKTNYEEFALKTKEGIKELFKDVVFTTDKLVTTKNGKYYDLVYTGTYAGMKMKMKQIFILQYGYCYVLIYTAKASTYDKNSKEADQIMVSFKPKVPNNK